jgi:hypothetical protein
MPRRNLSKLSATEDPYTLLKYPAAFQIALSDGKAVHNARQIAHFSKKAGLPYYQNMYRQRLSPEKTRELQRTLGFVERDGRMMTKRHAGKVRKLAKRELLRREGKPFVGPIPPPVSRSSSTSSLPSLGSLANQNLTGYDSTELVDMVRHRFAGQYPMNRRGGHYNFNRNIVGFEIPLTNRLQMWRDAQRWHRRT